LSYISRDLLVIVSMVSTYQWRSLNFCFLTFSRVAFVFWKVVSRKPLSKPSCVCLLLWKVVNGKYFLVIEKFGLISRKVFSFYFGRKTLSESCEKFRNVILFADYIKYGPQTFDCYIFCFEYLFFNFIP